MKAINAIERSQRTGSIVTLQPDLDDLTTLLAELGSEADDSVAHRDSTQDHEPYVHEFWGADWRVHVEVPREQGT